MLFCSLTSHQCLIQAISFAILNLEIGKSYLVIIASNIFLLWLQKTIKEFFPTWETLLKHEQVVLFAVGSMENPTPLVNYVYKTFVANETHKMRTSDFYLPRVDTELFTSLHNESTIPLAGSALHNQFINIYDHGEDRRRGRPVDTSPIHVLSKLYWWKIPHQIGHNIPSYNEMRWHCITENAKLAMNKLELIANPRFLGHHGRANYKKTNRNLKRNVKEATNILDQIKGTREQTDFPLKEVKEAPTKSEELAHKKGKDISVDCLHDLRYIKREVNGDFVTWLKHATESHEDVKDIKHMLRDLEGVGRHWKWEVESSIGALYKLIQHDEDNDERRQSNIVDEVEKILRDFNQETEDEAERTKLIQKVKLLIEDSDNTDKTELLDLIPKIDEFLKPWKTDGNTKLEDCVVAVEGRDCPFKTIDEIGKLQNISDLCVNGVHLYSSIFHLSEKAQSICFTDCILSKGFVWDLCTDISECKKLTRLQLIDNKHDLKEDIMGKIISSNQRDPPLQVLNLSMFLMPESSCLFLTLALAQCKILTHLDLSHNHLGQAGRNLAQSISSWGAETPLMVLSLHSTSVPEGVWPELLKSLSTCRRLTCLRLSGNTLTGSLSSFLGQPGDGLHVLEELWLNGTKLDAEDIQHLSSLVETHKVPGLKYLDMFYNEMPGMEMILQEFVTKCVNYHLEKMKIKLGDCNISKSSQKELTQLCEGTNVELSF